MFITALSNLDAADLSAYEVSPFPDVDIEDWYGKPITWAKSEGILHSGRPNDNITREEMAVIFANYLSVRDFPIVEKDVLQFADLNEASYFAQDSIQLMRRQSIIQGDGDNKYNPQAYASRAEVAQIFANSVKAVTGL